MYRLKSKMVIETISVELMQDKIIVIRAEFNLKVFQNQMLMQIFQPVRNWENGKLHREDMTCRVVSQNNNKKCNNSEIFTSIERLLY